MPARAEVPTLLLLHGAGSAATVWPEALLDLVAPATALDLPGHGEAPPPGRRTIAHYANVVIDHIEAAGLSDVVIVGHSMGGAIALEAAHRRHPALRGVVLLGSSGRLRVSPMLFDLLGTDFGAATALIGELGFAPEAEPELREMVREELLRCGPAVTVGDFLACSRFDLTAQLPMIPLPALIISGTADQLVPQRFCAATAAAMPNATFHAIEGAGHYLMLEAPGAVGRRIDAFRRELATRQSYHGRA